MSSSEIKKQGTYLFLASFIFAFGLGLTMTGYIANSIWFPMIKNDFNDLYAVGVFSSTTFNALNQLLEVYFDVSFQILMVGIIVTICGIAIELYYTNEIQKLKETIPTMYCRYCGAENKEDAVYCQKCGKKIGEKN